MPKKIPLIQIIESVLTDADTENYTEEEYTKYEDALEKNTRKLYRKFGRLIERLGSSKDILKTNGKNMGFDESEVPFMKVLLTQLYKNSGIIAQFTNDTNTKKSHQKIFMT